MVSSIWRGRSRLDRGDLRQDSLGASRPGTASGRSELVENDSQAEDVGAAVDPVPLAPGLLGTHVGGRAGESVPLAEVLLREHQAEVGDARFALEVEQDVGRLDVAVDQVCAYGRGGAPRAIRATISADSRNDGRPCWSRSARLLPGTYLETT